MISNMKTDKNTPQIDVTYNTIIFVSNRESEDNFKHRSTVILHLL